MIDMKDKKIDVDLLEEVAGGRFTGNIGANGILFGKKNDDDKNMNISDNKPGQRITTPGTIMRA